MHEVKTLTTKAQEGITNLFYCTALYMYVTTRSCNINSKLDFGTRQQAQNCDNLLHKNRKKNKITLLKAEMFGFSPQTPNVHKFVFKLF